jgi:branched-subunit amino acid transport protein
VSATWTTILVLAVVTAAIKATGPIVLGNRELPPWARRVIGLLAPALLAAFVVVETFGKGREVVLDARAAGLAAAAVALAARLSVLWAVGVAALATALTRALS